MASKIPKIVGIPQPEIIESSRYQIPELPVARRPTFILNEDDLCCKLGVPLEDLHSVMNHKQQTQKYHVPYPFQQKTFSSSSIPSTPTITRATTAPTLTSTSSPPTTSNCTKEDTIRQCRSTVVDWMSQVGDSYSLSNLTIHVGAALFDRILSEMDISRGMLQLLATACILIAAKSEETDDKVPTISQLNYCTDNTYTTDLVKQMESLILNRVEWDINIITPIHFLGLYLENTLFREELLFDHPIGQGYDRVKKDLISFSEFFVDLCRQDYNFLQYSPSMIAAASVAVTRRMLKITPIWSSHLVKSTGHEFDKLSNCCDHIWSVFEANFVLPGSPRSLS